MKDHRILPESWEIKPLSQIAEKITKGATPTTYGYKFQESGIKFIRIENVHNGKIDVNTIKDYICVEAHESQKRSQLEENDLLFSIAGTIGETCIIKKELLPANTNQAFAIIRGTQKQILPEFLLFQLNTFVSRIKSKARGGAMNNISLGDLKGIPITIPPIKIQKTIVEKIKVLFSELDAGRRQLESVKDLLKTYRQTVLKSAFEGKLTNENVKEGQLPGGWKWVKIEEVSESMKNGLYKPAHFYSNTGIACVRMYNISEGKIVWFNIKRMDLSKDEIEEYRLLEGDLLINRVNSRELVGKSAYIENFLEPVVFESKNIRLRLKKEVNGKYLNYWFGLNANKYFNTNAQQTVGMASINQDQVSNFKFPKPGNREEQDSIVQVIESRLSICDKLEETIETCLKQTEALKQSILKQAFEGKLVNSLTK